MYIIIGNIIARFLPRRQRFRRLWSRKTFRSRLRSNQRRYSTVATWTISIKLDCYFLCQRGCVIGRVCLCVSKQDNWKVMDGLCETSVTFMAALRCGNLPPFKSKVRHPGPIGRIALALSPMTLDSNFCLFQNFRRAYDHPWMILIQNIYGSVVSPLSFGRDWVTSDRHGSFLM